MRKWKLIRWYVNNKEKKTPGIQWAILFIVELLTSLKRFNFYTKLSSGNLSLFKYPDEGLVQKPNGVRTPVALLRSL